MKAKYPDDELTWFCMLLLGENTGVPPGLALKKESSTNAGLELGNYPNPFNPTTNIRFFLPEEGRVTLKVYDMLGRLVETLIDETRTTGPHQAPFNAASLPSGVYFYRLEALGKVLVNKLLVMK